MEGKSILSEGWWRRQTARMLEEMSEVVKMIQGCDSQGFGVGGQGPYEGRVVTVDSPPQKCTPKVLHTSSVGGHVSGAH